MNTEHDLMFNHYKNHTITHVSVSEDGHVTGATHDEPGGAYQPVAHQPR